MTDQGQDEKEEKAAGKAGARRTVRVELGIRGIHLWRQTGNCS